MGRIGATGWPGLALGAVLMAGCREELGPERWQSARVVGVVRQGGTPIGRGWIEFLPVEGTVGSLRSAEIRPDGSFEADGVPVGQVSVGVAGAPLDRSLSHTFHPLSTPIRRAIRAGGTNTLDIDLFDELIRLKQAEAGR